MTAHRDDNHTSANDAAMSRWLPRSLRRDESASVGIVFALALIPLLGFAGLALDYSRVSLAKSELQSAVDSAGLTFAHLPRDTPKDVLETKARTWVNARLAGRGLGQVTVTAIRDGTTIRFAASAPVNMTLFQVLRKEPVLVSAQNDVSLSIGKVEVALVLDNTRSMVLNNSKKLENLKTAATSLIDRLRTAAADPNQVRVGVVPFSNTVNVGSTYWTDRAAVPAPVPAADSWIDTKGLSSIHKEIFNNAVAAPSRFKLFSDIGAAWGGCVETRPLDYDVVGTPPDSANPDTLYVPFFAPDEPDSGYYNNYLGDAAVTGWDWKQRQGNYLKYNKPPKTPTTFETTLAYKLGPNAGCTLEPLLRLTKDLSLAKTRVTNMTAVGDTNIPAGLIWGLHLLSPDGPFKDGNAYDTPDLTKFIILMTDGDNVSYWPHGTNGSDKNNSYYSGIGYGWQKRLGTDTNLQGALDTRLAALCTNIKAKGIQIFTVRVEVNSSSSSLLENCASSKDMFHNVANSSDLNAAFNLIGDRISQLRLSK